MDSEIILWGLGIVVSVLLAFVGGKWVTNHRSQNAKANGTSTVIQSGRDTHLK